MFLIKLGLKLCFIRSKPYLYFSILFNYMNVLGMHRLAFAIHFFLYISYDIYVDLVSLVACFGPLQH